MLEENSIVDLNEDILELHDFMPLNIEDDFFDKMFKNLVVYKESNYYNNVCLSLVFYYVFILHCLLTRLYKSDEKHVELLKYLQITEKSLSKRDGNNSIHLKSFEEKNEINHYLFNGKEKEAINYFFHILNINETSQQCTKNQEIINLRNKIAHLNFFIATEEEFTKLREDIYSNFVYISDKLYQITKKLVYDAVIEYKTIDDFNFREVFENINKEFYLNQYDYRQFIAKDYFRETKTKTPKYYIAKYIKEELGLEIN